MSPPTLPPGGLIKPKFQPTALRPPAGPSQPNQLAWIPVLSAPCHFGLTTFLATLKSLTLHPEHNSTLILRADPLPLRDAEIYAPNENDLGDSFTDLGNMELVERVKVRLMPKMPSRDGKLDQTTVFYRTRPSKTLSDHADDDEQETLGSARFEKGLVITIPEAINPQDIPYFHPSVQRLAYKWEPVNANDEMSDVEDESAMPIQGLISIGYLPFPTQVPTQNTGLKVAAASSEDVHLLGRPKRAPRKRSPLAWSTDEPTTSKDLGGSHIPPPDLNHTMNDNQDQQVRLQRTCVALLERLYKHGYGAVVGYQQRIKHDLMIPRHTFQDLYLLLKDRHRHLDSKAPKPGSTKVEDLKRHVFKAEKEGLPDDPLLPLTDLSEWGQQDVAIASFLMLLWKDMYPPRSRHNDDSTSTSTGDQEQDWHTWGRPSGGFIDLGCGNGLLVHILVAEGYHGVGYELRARRTWPLYPEKTRGSLKELSIEPLSWFPKSIEEWESGEWEGKEECIIKEGTFLIGNHSDELTPWLPLLSLLPRTPSPHLSLPCCLHTLDALFDLPLTYIPPPHPATPEQGFEDGFETGASRYKTYLFWLGWCGLRCGWVWEKEGLRVPSTKGWGIVARQRWPKTVEEETECRQWVMDQVNEVRARGIFRPRQKEGHDH